MKKEYVIDIDSGHIKVEANSYELVYSKDGEVHTISGSVLQTQDLPYLAKLSWLDRKLLEED